MLTVASSISYGDFGKHGFHNSRMNSNKYMRNLRKSKNLTQQQVADRLGISRNAVSLWEKVGGTGPDKARLRDIASLYGVNPEDLLGEHDGSLGMVRNDVKESSANYAVGTISIPVMDVSGSMGVGRPMPECDTVIGSIQLSESWVRRNLSISSPENLSVISAYGDSMAPTFLDGDILLVDRGVSDIRLDAVYVMEIDGELFIKRIQRDFGGAITIISDNQHYRPQTLSNGDRKTLRVLGRVLWAWNGRRL